MVIKCVLVKPDNQPRESASAIQSKDEEPVVTKITDVPICEPFVDCVLQNLSLRVHRVAGDGNCLFHAIAHQCGRKESKATAVELRHLCATVMEKYPHIQREDGLSDEQWIKRKDVVQDKKRRVWGGDLEIRLLALGLKLDIVVITNETNGTSSARLYPAEAHPTGNMNGGIFFTVKTSKISEILQNRSNKYIVILYNGVDHFNTTEPFC